MNELYSLSDAIDKHAIRLLWAERTCIAFAYPPGRSNALSGSGPSVRDAVRELLAELDAYKQRRNAAKIQPTERGACEIRF